MKRLFAILIIFIIISVGTIVFLMQSNTGSQIRSHRYAVILNFTNDFPNGNDVPAHPGQALQAYWAIRHWGVPDENIYLFLQLETIDYIDYNYDDKNDLIGAQIDCRDYKISWTSVNNLFTELSQKLTNDDELVIYIASHGYSINSTYAGVRGNGFIIYENEFADMIKNIHVHKMVLFFDFCYAGNFASDLMAENRIIISEASANEETWCYWNWGAYLYQNNKTALDIFGDCGTVFSHPFWNKINENKTLIEAFNYANETFRDWAIIAPPSAYIVKNMHPFIRIGTNVTDSLKLYDDNYK